MNEKQKPLSLFTVSNEQLDIQGLLESYIQKFGRPGVKVLEEAIDTLIAEKEACYILEKETVEIIANNINDNYLRVAKVHKGKNKFGRIAADYRRKMGFSTTGMVKRIGDKKFGVDELKAFELCNVRPPEYIVNKIITLLEIPEARLKDLI